MPASGCTEVPDELYNRKLPAACTVAWLPIDNSPVALCATEESTASVPPLPADTRSTAAAPCTSSGPAAGAALPVVVSLALSSTTTESRAASTICGPVSAVDVLASSTDC